MSEAVAGVEAEVGAGVDSAEPTADVSLEATPEAEPTALTAEQQANVRSMLNSAIEARDRQWQERIASQQQNQPPPENTGEPAGSEIDGKIESLYTNDEVGRRTREAVNQHIELYLQKMGMDPSTQLTREEVQQIAAGSAGAVRDQIRSGLAVTQEVTDLVQRGMIGDEDATIVQQEYSARMNANGNHPAAANDILKATVYDLIKDSKIKPFARPRRNTSPLTPGGGAPANIGTPPPVDPAASPFQSVRNLSKEQLAKARNTSKNNYDKANAG
jgi:hypothetical protein